VRWFYYSNQCPGNAEQASLSSSLLPLQPSTLAASLTTAKTTLSDSDGAKDAAKDSKDSSSKDSSKDPPPASDADDVTPPSNVSHTIRSYMLLWVGLVVLALLMRYLPYWLQQTHEYQTIPTRHFAELQ